MLFHSRLSLCLLLTGVLLVPNAFATQSSDAASGADSHVTQLLTRLDQIKSIGAVAISPDGARLAWMQDGRAASRKVIRDGSRKAGSLSTHGGH